MSKTTSIVLALALCIHSIIEGVAIGISENREFVLLLCGTIAINHFIASISLAGTLSRSGFNLKQSLAPIICFAASTSLGIVIGLLIHNTSEIFNSVLLSISAGTFVYTSCTEIIQHELKRRGLKTWLQFLLIMLGGCLIIAMWFIGGGHDHDHGGDDHADDH